MKESMRRGKSISYIAKRLRRGYWAIQVQVNGYGVVNSCTNSASSILNKKSAQHSQFHHIPRHKPRFEQKTRIIAQKKKKYNQSGVKRCAQRNRKFEGKQGVLKTTVTEMKKEMKEMLGV